MDVFKAALELLPQLRRWRREFHRHPELGFAEHQTATRIVKLLHAWGCHVTAPVARTGVVGLISGLAGGPTLGIRADMDALPVQEQNRMAYRSCTAGVMHACGHDGNMAMSLGAAYLLSRWRASWRGRIKMVFQPCEERLPSGAQAMIAAGVLDHPRVEAMVAGHIDPLLPVGSIALKAGPLMANADAFTLTIQGQGGHGGMPHQSVDAVVVAAQVITALQTVVSRETDPTEPAVVTVGTIRGGYAYNVIAETVCLQGTLRSLTAAQRRRLPRRVEKIAAEVCRAMRARSQFQLDPGHPALHNHPRVTAWVRQAGWQVLGRKGVHEMMRPMMTGEDFTYFAARVPACFFCVGGSSPRLPQAYPWHHPRFNFDERGLAYGAAVLAQTALNYLSR